MSLTEESRVNRILSHNEKKVTRWNSYLVSLKAKRLVLLLALSFGMKIKNLRITSTIRMYIALLMLIIPTMPNMEFGITVVVDVPLHVKPFAELLREPLQS